MSGKGLPTRGQGAQSNVSGRYEVLKRIDVDDGWQIATVRVIDLYAPNGVMIAVNRS